MIDNGQYRPRVCFEWKADIVAAKLTLAGGAEMIRSFALALAVCGLAVPADANEPPPTGQLRFHKVAAAGQIMTVDVFMRQDRSGEPIWYQFRRSYGASDSRERRLAGWTDTRCPGSREALERLSRLKMPQPLIPGLLSNDGSEAAMDGWSHGLETRGDGEYRGNYIKLTSDAASPLARWIEETLVILEPCWAE